MIGGPCDWGASAAGAQDSKALDIRVCALEEARRVASSFFWVSASSLSHGCKKAVLNESSELALVVSCRHLSSFYTEPLPAPLSLLSQIQIRDEWTNVLFVSSTMSTNCALWSSWDLTQEFLMAELRQIFELQHTLPFTVSQCLYIRWISFLFWVIWLTWETCQRMFWYLI